MCGIPAYNIFRLQITAATRKRRDVWLHHDDDIKCRLCGQSLASIVSCFNIAASDAISVMAYFQIKTCQLRDKRVLDFGTFLERTSSSMLRRMKPLADY